MMTSDTGNGFQGGFTAQQFQFGDFILDRSRYRLQRRGRALRLERIPMELLILLVERQGDLVSREEIAERLWGKNVFLDVDHGINTAVRKIRSALRDDPEKPHFVETVVGKGYRFAAPVKSNNGNSSTLTQALSPPTSEAPTPDEGVSLGLPAGNQASEFSHSAISIRKTQVLTLVGVILAVVGTMFWLLSPVPSPRVLGYRQLTSDGQYKEGLFTDGSRLYFTMAKSARLGLFQMSTAGGVVTPVSIPFEQVGLSDISPDGSSLLVHPYAVDQSVDESEAAYELPLPAGIPRRVGAEPFQDATWSPDRQKIAYRKGHSLYVARSDGSAPRLLVTLPGSPLSPRWSPDGDLLRFFVWAGLGQYSIWQVRTDGSHLQQQLPGWNNPPAECCGQWTSDGRYFIFQSSRGDVPKGTWPGNLWAIREKGGYFRRVNQKPVRLTLTSTGTSEIVSTVPGRDGKRLFLISGNERYQLMRYDKNSASFVPYLSGINGIKFAFSRDGIWVAYVNIADNTLWRCKADGSERLQLTFPPMNANTVSSWSPDGSEIAFAASLAAGPLRIFRISRDGGVAEPLTEGDRKHGDASPSWSPDGKVLMFGEYQGEDDDSGAEQGVAPTNIWLLDLQTRKLTTVPGSSNLITPVWSPDGRHISARSKDGSLLVFSFATRNWAKISKPPNEWCAWSRDGRYIQCGSVVNGEPVVQRVRVSDQRREVLTSLKNLERVGFQNYQTWLGVGPNDSPLAIRNDSSWDIYAVDWELP